MNDFYCENDEPQCPGLVALRADYERSLRVAAGMLSTHPQYADKHPEVALADLKAAIEAVKGGERG